MLGIKGCGLPSRWWPECLGRWTHFSHLQGYCQELWNDIRIIDIFNSGKTFRGWKKHFAFTVSRCFVDVRRIAGVTFALVIDGNDPEAVWHVGPQWEVCMLLVSFYPLQLLPTPLLHVLVLKFNHILYKELQNALIKEKNMHVCNMQCVLCLSVHVGCVLNLGWGCCGRLLESSWESLPDVWHLWPEGGQVGLGDLKKTAKYNRRLYEPGTFNYNW